MEHIDKPLEPANLINQDVVWVQGLQIEQFFFFQLLFLAFASHLSWISKRFELVVQKNMVQNFFSGYWIFNFIFQIILS